MRYDWLAILVATLCWLAALPIHAEGAGEALFLTHCSRCHGTDGRGHGPDSAGLETPPADLTRLDEKYGSRVPRSLLIEIIDGRRWAIAHGPREMPVWGDVFSGGDSASPSAQIAAQRIIEVLSDYVLSLQRTQSASLE